MVPQPLTLDRHKHVLQAITIKICQRVVHRFVIIHLADAMFLPFG